MYSKEVFGIAGLFLRGAADRRRKFSIAQVPTPKGENRPDDECGNAARLES
jgi:hypothetical protein